MGESDEQGKSQPTYSLDEIKALIRANRYQITIQAFQDASRLKFDEDDIVECVLALGGSCFVKSDPSLQHPGLWHDVYCTEACGERIYLKLQVPPAVWKLAKIVSFKRRNPKWTS